jgi:hypothetical protein
MKPMSQAQHTSTAVLSDLLEPVGQMMPIEFAEKLAALRATPQVQARIDELAEKSSEGQLTPDERIEYLAYVDAIDVISILQAKARSVLARQPNS